MSAMRLVLATAALLLLGLSGCAPMLGSTREPAYQGNGVAVGAHVGDAVLLYQDSAGPLSYRADARIAGPARPVNGRACQSALTLPVVLLWGAVRGGSLANAPGFVGAGWGDGGYIKAATEARASIPAAHLVDVRADLRTTVILGLWRRQCVELSALALEAPHSPPVAPPRSTE